ncbi:MAG: beta-propeller fold lactonase family protein [Planctomycetota bacterium]
MRSTPRLLSRCCLVALTVFSVSCGPVVIGASLGGGGGGGGGGGPVPPEIRIADSKVFVIDRPIAAVAPVLVAGTAPDEFSISPALPSGIGFNKATGEIAGTPAESSPPTLYTVTATNAAGSGVAPITITVLLRVAKRAYVANPDAGTVSILGLNATTGRLEPKGSRATPPQPLQVAVHPSEQFLYVLCSAAVAVLRIKGDGGLDPVMTIPATGLGPSKLLVHPLGHSVYVLNSFGLPAGSVSVLSVDGSTGGLSNNGAPVATGPLPVSMALHPGGGSVYVVTGDEKIQQFSVAADGKLSLVKALTLGFQGGKLVVARGGGFAYVLDPLDKKLRVLAVAADGTLSKTNRLAETGVFPNQIRSGPESKYLYVSSFNRIVDVYKVDRGNGSLERLIASQSSSGMPATFAPDPSRNFAFVMNEGLKTVDLFPLKQDGSLDGAKRSSYQLAQVPQSIAYTLMDPVLSPASFGFVSSAGSNRIQAFRVRSEEPNKTGALAGGQGILEPLGSLRSGQVPVAMLERDGFVFVASWGSRELTVYRHRSGKLEYRSSVPAGTRPESLAAHPGVRFLYAGSRGSVRAFAFDREQAQLTAVFETDLVSRPSALIVDAAARFLFAADAASDRIQVFRTLADGSLEPVARARTAAQPVALALDPAGELLYVSAFGGARLECFRVDAASGQLSLESEAPTGRNPASLALHPRTGLVYVTNEGSDTVGVYRKEAGALQLLAELASSSPRRITLDGQYAYVSSRGASLSVFMLNEHTGLPRLRGRVRTGAMPGALVLAR